jgi:hypothetical protein
LVVRPVPASDVVSYTHVLPTATGNGIESAFTNDPDPLFPLVLARVPVLGVALLWVPGIWAARDAAEAEPGAVLAVLWPGTSGAVPFGEPLHPARANMAAPARTAAADSRLLMSLPRPGEVMPASRKPGLRH